MDHAELLPDILRHLVFISLCALAVLVVFNKLRLPPIVGFLFTGVLIGPAVLGFVHDTKEIHLLAEVGVVLLLFSIGMEFSLEELFHWKTWMLLAGGGQILLTIGASTLIARVFGVEWKSAIFLGALFSLSSTAVVLKALVQRNELHAPHGQMTTAILLAQDLAIIPFLLFTPLLGGESVSAMAVVKSVATAAIIIGGMILVARLLVPRFLKQIAYLRSREAFVLAALVLSLGAAWVTAEAGLSLAIGAFIAGIIVSESEYSNQIVADVMPLRDSFSALFFISIGMLLVVPSSGAALGRVLAITVGLIGGKALIAALFAGLLTRSLRIGLQSGFALAQVGEFSFVLAQVGEPFHLLSETLYTDFLTASVLSIMATPMLIAAAPRLSHLFQRAASAVAADDHGAPDHIEDHVVIVGFGLTGQNVAHALRATGVAYRVIELNAQTVEWARESQGEPILYGDAMQPETLEKASIGSARMLIVTVPQSSVSRSAIRTARQENADVIIVVRAQFASEVDELMRIGANVVVAEEFETSMQIVEEALTGIGVSADDWMTQVESMRRVGRYYFAHHVSEAASEDSGGNRAGSH